MQRPTYAWMNLLNWKKSIFNFLRLASKDDSHVTRTYTHALHFMGPYVTGTLQQKWRGFTYCRLYLGTYTLSLTVERTGCIESIHQSTVFALNKRFYLKLKDKTSLKDAECNKSISVAHRCQCMAATSKGSGVLCNPPPPPCLPFPEEGGGGWGSQTPTIAC